MTRLRNGQGWTAWAMMIWLLSVLNCAPGNMTTLLASPAGQSMATSLSSAAGDLCCHGGQQVSAAATARSVKAVVPLATVFGMLVVVALALQTGQSTPTRSAREPIRDRRFAYLQSIWPNAPPRPHSR